MNKIIQISMIFLAVTLVAGIGVAFEGGTGESNDPYQIENLDQLNDTRNELDAHYELIDNIDASETENWNDGDGWEPIGDNDNNFEGTFDGQGYEINDLYIDRPNTDYVGLFGFTGSTGVVENVGVVDVNITGGWYTGGLVGRNWGGRKC